MPKTNHKTHHTSTHHKTKTHVVTNTQLAIAVAAAFFAGGLAYVATPRINYGPNACTVSSVQFIDRCHGSNYRGADYRCSDGSTGQISSRSLCRNTKKLQRMVAKLCAQQQCVQDVEDEVPAAPEREAIDPNSCEVNNLEFFNRCGRNQYSKLEVRCSNGHIESSEVSCQSVADLQQLGSRFCATQDCSPRHNSITPVEDQNTDSTMTNPTDTRGENNSVIVEPLSEPVAAPIEVAPIAIHSGPKLLIPGPISFQRANGKISLRITLENKGTADADSSAKYTFAFLDAQGNTLMIYSPTLSSDLKVGEAADFGIVVSIPQGATAVRAAVDPSVACFENNTVTTQIPVEFLPRQI